MRRTMASQSSLYNEERNLLRIREWERRNQESLQEKEFSQENVPLFGEPYKTNKGDELSSRIQRMLGSYEDVNNPQPCLDNFTKDPSSSSSSSHVMFGRSPHVRPAHTDKAKPPFQGQNPSQYGSGLSGSSSSNPSSSHSPQSLKKLPVPEPYGPSPRYSQPSLGHSQGSPPNPHPRKGEAWVDLRECTSLPPVLSAFSPPAEPLSPLHSSDPSDSEPQDTDDKDTPERHQGFAGHPESPGSAMKLSPLDPQRDTAPPPPPQANKGTVLPSQTFPPPLASKQPNLVMPPKPTAYVRPMDGQDQVVNESPDLKTSPEGFHGQPYEPLPELKTSKPSLSKLKIPSQSIETLSNEVQCVEDILKEMTHSWPPLLTAIHTPSTAEPSKFSFPAKEAQHVPPAYPGQKPYGSPPTASQQSSSCPSLELPPPLPFPPRSTGAAAHSSGVESASSSDSESSSGSESDSESSEGEEAPPPLGGSSPAVKAEGPMVTNWQLNNWIRVSQQNPSTESQGEAPLHSPAPKQPPGHGAEEEGVAAADRGLEFSDNKAKPQAKREGTHNNPHGRHKPPVAAAAASSSSSSSSHNPSSQRKTVANKHPSKPAMSSRPDDPRPQAGLRVESVEVAPRDKDPSFTDRPKVKTKMGHGKSGAGKTDAKKSAKRSSSDKRKAEAASQGPKGTLAPDCKREADRGPSVSPRPGPSPAPVEQPSPAPAPASAPNLAQTAKTSSKVRTETVPQNGQKKPSGPPPTSSPAPQPSSKRGSSAKASERPQFPSKALLVKIELSLITRVPQTSKPSQEGQDKPRQKRPLPERRDVNKAPIATKVSRKRPAGGEIKTQPKKRPKLEKEVKIPPSSSSAAAAAAGHTSVKSVAHGAPGAAREKKKAKKASPQQPPTPQDPGKAPGQKRSAEDGPGPAPHAKNPPAKHKKSSGKRTEHSKTGKKAPKTSFVVPAATTSLNSRPLLKFEERQYPVEHHMKEAKKLKHKADDTSDKVGKAFNYLDAAMSFVESGIAMETDPQTPKSAYTMFAETLDLIRFIMKLKNSMDPSAPSTERDFTVLCMKGQSLLQMAMFRYKRELALKYSRTLTDHFKSSSKTAQAPSPCISKGTGAPSPMSPMPSPASSSGPGSNHSGGAAGPSSNTVAIPQVIQQVACSYVNITALFLNAHDIWEQAQELAPRGSGVLSELDSALGPLSLTSSMVSLVRYTRQGLHWLRLDTRGTQ